MQLSTALLVFKALERSRVDDNYAPPVYDVRLDATTITVGAEAGTREFRVRVTAGREAGAIGPAAWGQVTSLAIDQDVDMIVQNNGIELV